MKDMIGLLDAIHLAYSHPEYAPNPDGTTHCNQFVSEVCHNYGFSGLEGLLANDIVKTLSSHVDWSEVSLEKAQDLANAGTLIVAGIQADPHGHVNIICPGKTKLSGRWGSVPSVANVGKDNFIGKGINWAFSDPPKMWAWKPSL